MLTEQLYLFQFFIALKFYFNAGTCDSLLYDCFITVVIV